MAKHGQVYLKQKLNCVLMSREEMEKPKKELYSLGNVIPL